MEAKANKSQLWAQIKIVLGAWRAWWTSTRLGHIKGQTLWFAAQFAIMPHIQFHFNCNNFGQSQKKERYKMYIYIYVDIWISIGCTRIWLNFNFIPCYVCECVCVACFSAVKCISHFIVHSIKNPFPFAVCANARLYQLYFALPDTATWTHSRTPGTVLVYSKNMPARVSTGGCLDEWIAELKRGVSQAGGQPASRPAGRW